MAVARIAARIKHRIEHSPFSLHTVWVSCRGRAADTVSPIDLLGDGLHLRLSFDLSVIKSAETPSTTRKPISRFCEPRHLRQYLLDLSSLGRLMWPMAMRDIPSSDKV